MSRHKRGLFLANCLILTVASFTFILLPSSGAGASSTPTLTLTPSTGVRAEQKVTAFGTMWPKGSARLFECGRSEPVFESSVCHSISSFDLTRSSWSKSFESIVGTVGHAGSYCLDPTEGKPFTCYVEFQVSSTTVSTPITFKALKIGGISSGGSYENGTTVNVTLTNFPTEQKFTLKICPNGGGYTQCGQGTTKETGSSGTASFPNYQLNCVQIDPEGTCYLVVTDTSKPRGPWAEVGFETYGL